MRRPNIILLMADQLTAFALENYGNRIVKAPNIASLSENGVTFESAYCNFPICAPSRYSLLSGRLPHAIKAFDNASEFAADQPTLLHYLRRLDYNTALSGKMHFVGPDQLHGYGERLNTDIYPADFAWVPNWKAGPRNAPTGISMRAVVEAGPCVRSLQLDYDEETAFLAKQKIYDLARSSSNQPFFLTVSFSHPHSPYTASQAHWDRYRHDDIDMPRTGAIPLKSLDTHSYWLYFSHGRDRIEVTHEHVRNARHAYYGMVSYVDDKVGELMEVLRQTKLLHDAIIIFTSDHGEMLGERGMWYKQTFFESASRVPLIISGPGIRKGHRVDRNVSLVDLMPTILSLANDGKVDVDTPLDGSDLADLACGGTVEGSDLIVSEYSDMGVCAPCRMIREGDFKYIYVHRHESMLFDLRKDPLEHENLSGRPESAEIESRLRTALLNDWDPEAISQQILESQAGRELIWAVTKDASQRDNWSYEARKGDKQRYVRGGGDAEGTVAVKGRARFPYVPPTPLAEPKAMPFDVAYAGEPPGGGKKMTSKSLKA
ncbi:MAG: choline-sulfatase [Candidimonas sp.]|nr:MAG: choline-sulfatase [Candidimonas sp.]TAM22148.1 MAG: choline-sulfatase [Candidimonas sp.]TAM77387.1 MAG: choline-sulfatase [Candidimonas sp.]